MPINPYNKYIKQYQTNNITTASPEKLMIMLLDGAYQFLQKAKTAIENKNLQERSQNIEAARKIIRELMRTIDLENGNTVSKQVFKLYSKMATKLIKANVQRNAAIVGEVLEDLANLRWGFQKAIDIQSGVTTIEEALAERADLQQAPENDEKSNLTQEIQISNDITTQENQEDNSNAG